MESIAKVINSKKTKVRMDRLRKFVKDHGMNWGRLLCGLWQISTGKKCTNKKHRSGIYDNEKLECEAQMVESMTLQYKIGCAKDEEFERLILDIEEYAKNNTN